MNWRCPCSQGVPNIWSSSKRVPSTWSTSNVLAWRLLAGIQTAPLCLSSGLRAWFSVQPHPNCKKLITTTGVPPIHMELTISISLVKKSIGHMPSVLRWTTWDLHYWSFYSAWSANLISLGPSQCKVGGFWSLRKKIVDQLVMITFLPWWPKLRPKHLKGGISPSNWVGQFCAHSLPFGCLL